MIYVHKFLDTHYLLMYHSVLKVFKKLLVKLNFNVASVLYASIK